MLAEQTAQAIGALAWSSARGELTPSSCPPAATGNSGAAARRLTDTERAAASAAAASGNHTATSHRCVRRGVISSLKRSVILIATDPSRRVPRSRCCQPWVIVCCMCPTTLHASCAATMLDTVACSQGRSDGVGVGAQQHGSRQHGAPAPLRCEAPGGEAGDRRCASKCWHSLCSTPGIHAIVDSLIAEPGLCSVA